MIEFPTTPDLSRARKLAGEIDVPVYGPNGPDTETCSSAWQTARLITLLQQQVEYLNEQRKEPETDLPKADINPGADGPAPVAKGGSLVGAVHSCIVGEPECGHMQARAAILVVADWIYSNHIPALHPSTAEYVAKSLRREVYE